MKYFFGKFKKHIRTLGQIVLVFGAAFLILLYFLGYYDFSFLDRYKLFFGDENPSASNKNPFVSIEIDPPKETEDPGTGTESAPESETQSGINPALPEAETKIPTNTALVMDENTLPDTLTVTFRTEAASAADGYTAAPTDGSYRYDSARTELAKVVFDFNLPTKYAMRVRSVLTEQVVTPGENGENTDDLVSDESYVVLKTKRQARPAVELYMGYILLDDGDSFYLLDDTGKPLCRYDAQRYLPAYARDSADRPLFYRVDEVQRTNAETGGQETVEVTRYFHLSEDGTSFVLSDFDPLLDGRGLYFDYPSSYGKSAVESLYIYGEEVEVVPEKTEEDEAEEVSADASDALSADGEAAEEPETVLAMRCGYEYRSTQGYVWSRLTSPRFVTAFAFSEGRAAVTADENRGSLYYLTESGYRAFANVSTYINEHNRYVTEYLMPPLTHGLESVGHYYYDNGLVRARKQIIDYWYYEMRDKTRVVKDYDCLLRLDGTEVPLPAGFELEGYADGMAILSRDKRVGIYDVGGEWIAQPIYASATPYLSGLCVLKLLDGRVGMIDRLGNIVLPFTYDSISVVSSGLIAAYRAENGWTVFRLMDKVE
ncbi:MAG: WG repeat-containing protein [Clostridia bacterium]|nr:WG repeat-containing protein [Clostridia bacterium]